MVQCFFLYRISPATRNSSSLTNFLFKNIHPKLSEAPTSGASFLSILLHFSDQLGGFDPHPFGPRALENVLQIFQAEGVQKLAAVPLKPTKTPTFHSGLQRNKHTKLIKTSQTTMHQSSAHYHVWSHFE